MEQDTRSKILDSAERMFAQKGFAGASMRSITTAAGVNLASVNYHFGSKQDLLIEVLRRRIEPINRRRLAILQDELNKAGGAPLPLESIIRAKLVPLVEAIGQGEVKDTVFLQMIGRSFSEPTELTGGIHRRFFKDVDECFRNELKRTLPNLDEAEITIRFHYTICLMLGALTQHWRLIQMSGEHHALANNVTAMIDRMCEFACGGFRAALNSSDS